MTDALFALARLAESLGQRYWRDAPALETVRNAATNGKIELLFRSGQFQIERISHGPNETIPFHRHPNTDSYELPLWGSGQLWLGKRKFDVEEETAPWRLLFVSHRCWHGGRSFERGGAFLSVQQHCGEARASVICDWEEKHDGLDADARGLPDKAHVP